MQHKDDLIQYRVQRAAQTLNEARTAMDNNSLPLAENRIYYAIFYIVSALALKFDFSTSKHSTLRGWFNQMFLKSMAIDISFGKTYSAAFEKRQKADYDDFVSFTPEEVSIDIENAQKFVEQIKTMILNSTANDTTARTSGSYGE
ncbi:MAG TPA: HEPN domain-containing protein [Candidatus Deferrimicrobium sp.]|nr:HEPN domain-containing protein [Candidatus Deferrimicrobium sp.]